MGFVKERGSDSIWMAEPGDVISIYRKSDSNVAGVEARYTVTEEPNTNLDSWGRPIGDGASASQLFMYRGRRAMIEDWTKRRGDKLIGYVGVVAVDLRSNKKYGLIVVPYNPVDGQPEPETQPTELVAEAGPIEQPEVPVTPEDVLADHGSGE